MLHAILIWITDSLHSKWICFHWAIVGSSKIDLIHISQEHQKIPYENCFQVALFPNVKCLSGLQDRQTFQHATTFCGDIFDKPRDIGKPKIKIQQEIVNFPLDMLRRVMKILSVRLQQSICRRAGHLEGMILKKQKLPTIILLLLYFILVKRSNFLKYPICARYLRPIGVLVWKFVFPRRPDRLQAVLNPYMWLSAFPFVPANLRSS